MTAYWSNGIATLYHADAREIPLPDGSVHCIVTSPPYFGLRQYADVGDQGIGLESTPEAFVANLVAVARECWRVLRDDGVMWWNLGDSYTSQGGRTGQGGTSQRQGRTNVEAQNAVKGVTVDSLATGNQLLIPHRVALALQQDGWILRDTIIWHKPAPMPESLGSTRWEPCRVKVGTFSGQGKQSTHPGSFGPIDGGKDLAQWEPCPGCAKCEPTDGLVLRRGSWRCTASFEYIFMFCKSMNYWSDGEAVKVAATHAGRVVKATGNGAKNAGHINRTADGFTNHDTLVGSTANRRNVWHQDTDAAQLLQLSQLLDVPEEVLIEALEIVSHPEDSRTSLWSDIRPEPYKGAHYASYPTDLPRICIQASTSERGCCPACGAQWARVVEHRVSTPRQAEGYTNLSGRNDGNGNRPGSYMDADTQTLSWRPTCACPEAANPVPATVLDPFCGTGTTCCAAQRLGRRSIGVDLSETYLRQAVKRLEGVALPLI